jgi:hypothetical protein
MKQDVLEKRVADLEAENRRLKSEIDFLRTHSLLTTGMRGETLIAKIVGGRTTSYATSHDVEARDGSLIEVKRSKLCIWDKRSGSMKWQWAKLFGESGKKKFDYIILVGDADPRYKVHYKDKNSPYVLFCVPFREIEGLSAQGQRDEYRHIQMGTNPLSARRRESIKLFQQFQITEAELTARFDL